MLAQLTRNWWIPLIRGIAAILFGIVALVWPGATLGVLILFFGAYALVDGVFAFVGGLTAAGTDAGLRWALVLTGLAGILVGLITFFWPGITATVLLAFIIAWAVVTGIFEIVAAIRLRAVIANEWLYILSGVASVAFGVLALIYPNSGALSIIWLIGFYAIVAGVALVGFAFRVRSLGNTVSNLTSRPA
ncbi:MAG TPA: HdeD family acid-resistance protein [Chloroflexia bacterium]|nr:HdeD family acid-resistance protein [Chloroflexia bacterium]